MVHNFKDSLILSSDSGRKLSRIRIEQPKIQAVILPKAPVIKLFIPSETWETQK